MRRLHWIGNDGRRLFVVGAILLAAMSQARADDQYIGVARVSVFNGTVVMQHAGSADKIAAIVNAPVMVGDYITTGAGSRTEIQLDDTDFVRAGAQTQIRFTRLDQTDHTVQLAAGTIEVSALRYPEAHPQVQTPSLTIRPSDAGRYRVTVTESGETLVTVRSGRADLLTPQGTSSLGAGTSVLATGPASNPHIQDIATIAYDDFDAWNSDRDSFTASALAATASSASAYANSGIVGLTDLNAYGRWGYSPAYGSVWFPYGQSVGWSPYRFGRWAYQPYCGWTWIGYEPWGWAPYHYGRWFYQPGFGWAWYPGPRFYPYYWQPALVAFFGLGYGGGYGFGFNFSFGNVAWVPLAPFEPYYPWWRRGVGGTPIAYRNPIIKNVGNITKVYSNGNAPGGIAVIHGGDLNRGMTYQYIPLHEGDLRNVALAKGGLPVAPLTSSYRYASGSAEVGQVAPLSPRFSMLPAAGVPTTASTPHSNAQMVGLAPVADRGASAHVAAASGDPWGRFASANTRTVTVAHMLNGTQTSVGSAHAMTTAHGTSSAPASGASQMHPDTASSAWGRFESMDSGKTEILTAHSVQVVHSLAPSYGDQRYSEPGTFRAPTSQYGQYAPNAYSPSHSSESMSPRSTISSPHGSGTASGGNYSGHQGNGH